MPPNRLGTMDDLSSDDYVAQVLAREARDNSANYARQGAEAYLPRRPTGAAPKPNTRFLRHIINQTDSHNAALKRKEEREARDKMQQLRRNRLFSMDDQDHPRDSRHRPHRSSDTKESERDRKDHHRHTHRRRRRSRSPSGDRERSHKHRRRHESYDDDDGSDKDHRHKSSRRSRRHRSESRSRSRSPRHDRDHESSRRHRRRHHKRSASPSRSRSRSPDGDRARRKARDEGRRSRGHASSRRLSPSFSKSASRLPPPPSGHDSDPLEDLVGPLPPKIDPPIRSRGRGAYNLSNIDAHFAADYDPSMDVQPDEEETNKPSNGRLRRHVAGLMTAEDDWEASLEAVRDRARWKQQGEDRLREAGFGDDFVQRWKKNTTASTTAAGDDESRIEDVKWSRKGEGREWDRGKVIDEDGHVELKAPW
ncbi:hypothetical protein P168DRAFT_326230 [Aspergillus campestris IBT 28561]|uniref:Uncharacterized protein n=1 Tax=Aspergillus campestris (strain IBT 28561) TaxID=1392248 RepID=A0A2I1D7S7_ASPC2|nr:uncharacterized protein P168DRAFT_326230 [Aspergillus campestris IBT 28561]PKY05931.1 hypothetical protein P168DRAFT_326230 [Aspergillus campestris IBT 28561]